MRTFESTTSRWNGRTAEMERTGQSRPGWFWPRSCTTSPGTPWSRPGLPSRCEPDRETARTRVPHRGARGDMVLGGPIRLRPSPRGPLPDFGRPQHDEREPVPDPAVAVDRSSPSSPGRDDPRGYVRGPLRFLAVALVHCFGGRVSGARDRIPA